MKTIKVYGELQERLGGRGTFHFNVRTPAEAVKALLANFPGLDKWLINSSSDGLVYRVLVGNQAFGNEDVEDLFLPWSDKDVFHIIPVLAGSIFGWIKKNLGSVIKFVVGATLTVIGVATGYTPLVYIGISMMIGGVMDMLTPTPKPPREAEVLESYSFSGIEQTTGQGGAVPIVYGKCFIGSSVLSAGIQTFED